MRGDEEGEREAGAQDGEAQAGHGGHVVRHHGDDVAQPQVAPEHEAHRQRDPAEHPPGRAPVISRVVGARHQQAHHQTDRHLPSTIGAERGHHPAGRLVEGLDQQAIQRGDEGGAGHEEGGGVGGQQQQHARDGTHRMHQQRAGSTPLQVDPGRNQPEGLDRGEASRGGGRPRRRWHGRGRGAHCNSVTPGFLAQSIVST